MAPFRTITDKDYESDKLNAELSRLRKNGLVLPRHSGRAAQSYGEIVTQTRDIQKAAGVDLDNLAYSVGKTITSGNLHSPEVQSMVKENEAKMQAMGQKRDMSYRAQHTGGMRRMGSIRRTAASMTPGGTDAQNAIPRFYDPLEYWDLSGLPWNVADEGHRHKLHKWLRLYYATHYLVPTLIDIFTRFPLIGIELESKDAALKDIYEEIFLRNLKYDEFFVGLGREYWTVGECFPLGSFDEDLGVWEHEELINPEDVVIDNFPFLNTQQLKIVPPDYLRRIAQTKSPAREWFLLQEQYADLIPYLLKGEHIPISPVMIRQVANKMNNWDDHGTPILLRGLRTLLYEEKLLASQEAIAERLYSPLILAKLGIMDMGEGLPPWIPTPAELESVRDDLDIALSSDFRLMVHHFGLDITSVFGREQMPRLGDDFDRIERRIMQCLSGDTLVHTIDGLIPARDLEGKNVDVLSLGGVYRKSHWECYGEQELYKIVLENGDELEATAGHEWLVCQGKVKHKRVTTNALVGRRIPMQYIKDDFDYDEVDWRQGAQHGLIYGDGWLYLNGKYTMVRQHGNSQHLVPDLFDNFSLNRINHTASKVATTATKQSNQYKKLPSLEESPSYLRGFIAGFIASDGSVDDTGHVEIAQANLECLQGVREIAKKASLPTVAIQETTANMRKHNSKFREDGESFELSFAKAGFFTENNGFDSKLILKNAHREYATKCGQKRKRYSVRVVDVIPTGRVEKVYCCVEPETHSFVIENHYLTGNCFGVNPSLLSAGSNSQPYASSALQAEFMNQILKTYQNMLKSHYRERALVVAEAQGHQDYEKKGSTRVPIFERVVVYDEEGNKEIKEVPKLLVPTLTFESLDLRDEATERQFLMELRQMGVPLPNADLLIGVDWKYKDKIDEYNTELKEQTIAQQQAKMETYYALTVKGLPVPLDLKAECESVLVHGPGSGGGAPQGATQGMGGAPGGPGAGAPPGGPGAGPGGEAIVMPPAPPGLGAGPGTAPPGGGPPPTNPMAPGPAGTVPQVSNERRPGLTYNTSNDGITRFSAKEGSDFDEYMADNPNLGLPFIDYIAQCTTKKYADLTHDEIDDLHNVWPKYANEYQQRVANEIATKLASSPEVEKESAIVVEPEKEFVLKSNQELQKTASGKEKIVETPSKTKVKFEQKKKYGIIDVLASDLSEDDKPSESTDTAEPKSP